MKRIITLLITAVLLCGCGKNPSLDAAMELRNKLQSGNGCSFDAAVTADYGDELYEFSMRCSMDPSGELTFTVLKPDTIQGITGKVYGDSGELTFDNQALAFETLADGYISPVCAPWVLIHTLRGGYLKSSGEDGEYTRIAIDDSYEEDALHLDVWIDGQGIPVRADILYKGRRCLVLDVSNFSFL